MATYEEIKQSVGSNLTKIKFEPGHPMQASADSGAISALESGIHFKLPNEYKAFLELTNGGTSVSYNIFAYNELVMEYQFFYGLYSDESYKQKDLLTVHEKTKHYVPYDLLPIAYVGESEDGQLCLGLSDSCYGKIYYCPNKQQKAITLQESLGTITRDGAEEIRNQLRPAYTNVSYVSETLISFFMGCFFVGNTVQKKTY